MKNIITKPLNKKAMNLTYQNPLVYRKYRIFEDDSIWAMDGRVFAYLHEDYDGAIDAGDYRSGRERTIEDCISEIDELEEKMSELMPIYDPQDLFGTKDIDDNILPVAYMKTEELTLEEVKKQFPFIDDEQLK